MGMTHMGMGEKGKSVGMVEVGIILMGMRWNGKNTTWGWGWNGDDF